MLAFAACLVALRTEVLVQSDRDGLGAVHRVEKQDGKVTRDVWAAAAEDQDHPAWRRIASYDQMTGACASLLAESYGFDRQGKLSGGYRFNVGYDGPVPKPVSAEKLASDGRYHQISYRITGPSLIAIGAPFSVEVLEVDGRSAMPLASGSLVVWNGMALPVGDRGQVVVPFAAPGYGRYRFDFQVHPAAALDSLPFGYPGPAASLVAEAMWNGRGAAMVKQVKPMISGLDGIRLFGTGLGPDWKVDLIRPGGQAFALRASVGSPLERIYIDPLPPLGGDCSLRAVSPQGQTFNSTSPLKQPDFNYVLRSAKIVGNRGDYTFTANTEGFIRIFGGDPYIALDERVFAISPEHPHVVGYAALQPGVFDLTIEYLTEIREHDDDPPCTGECGTPVFKRDGGKTTVDVPVTLKTPDGKGVPGDTEIGVGTPVGVETGTAHCGEDGKGTAHIELSVDVDLTDVIARVLKAPAHRLPAANAAQECCIQGVTFTNDTDLPVFYRAYQPATKDAKRQEFATTDAVPPGGTITIRGNFGHCVRVAALRKPVPFSDEAAGTPGLVSDREVCCHGMGKEDVMTRDEGLRQITVDSGPCPDAAPPAVPTPPAVPKQPDPPVTPPDKPKYPPTVWPPYTGWDPGLKYWPGPVYHDPYDFPPPVYHPPHIAIQPPREVVPCTDVDGEFEPIQAVWQDDRYFDDKPGKRIVKTGPAAYHAELDMVADKSTLVGGQLKTVDGYVDNHTDITFKGIAHGSEWTSLKIKVELSQAGATRVVYESDYSVAYLPVLGPPGGAYPFHAWAPAVAGLPEESSAQLPFKMTAGPYSLKASLVTMDGKDVGIAATVAGDAKVTQPTTLYFFPATMELRTTEADDKLLNFTKDLAQATHVWGSATFPVRDQGFPTFLMPQLDIQDVYKSTELGFGAWLKSKLPLTATEQQVRDRATTDGLIATATNLANLFSRLAGNGKTVLVMDDTDFDKTVYKPDQCGAACISQKTILCRTDVAYMSMLHETTHGTPHLWSETQMQQQFQKVWHNNPVQYWAEGLKIYGVGPFRRRYDSAWVMMGPYGAKSTDDDRWITQASYKHLLDYFQTGADPEVVDIRCAFVRTPNGVVGHLSPLYTQPGVPEPEGDPSPFVVTLLDKAGHVLHKQMVTADFTWADDTDQHFVAAETLRLARPANLASVVLTGPSGVLDKIDLSPAPPTVSFDGAMPRIPTDRIITLSWKAASPSGRPLLSTVLYSPDGGTTWAPAMTEQAKTSAMVLFQGVITKPMVKVVVTDGTQSSQAIATLPFP